MRPLPILTLAAVAALSLSSGNAWAQVNPNKPQPNPAYSKPGQNNNKPYGAQASAKSNVNPWNAAHATKEMLMKHGYKVVGVEQFEDGNVLYYRRGDVMRASEVSIEKAVVRMIGESVEIEGVPRPVLADIKAKLGI